MHSKSRLLVPSLPAGCHAMSIGNRGNGNSSGRKRRTTLDVAWWRWDHAGAVRGHPGRGRMSWSGGTPSVDVDHRGFAETGSRRGRRRGHLWRLDRGCLGRSSRGRRGCQFRARLSWWCCGHRFRARGGRRRSHHG